MNWRRYQGQVSVDSNRSGTHRGEGFDRPKASQVQTQELTRDTLRAARAWFASGDAPTVGKLLRGSRKGGRLTETGMSERAITKRAAALGAAIGVYGLSAHDLRHSWATRAARNKTDAFDLYLFQSLKEVRQLSEHWLHSYNQDRPHDALGGQTPIAFALAAVI
jgi:integrase